MRTFLAIIGGAVLLVVGVVAAGIGYVAFEGSSLDRESKAYADQAIVAIVTNWDLAALESRESPEFAASTSDADLRKLFNIFRTLGVLRHYDGCSGDSLISANSGSGSTTTAHYVGRAEFAGGPARIDITLVKHGGEWRIAGFRVDAKRFLDLH